MIAFVAAMCLGGHAVRAEAEHPCEEIKAACEKANFVKGEAGEGRGLWKDCIEPIVMGTPPPKKTVLPLPAVDPKVIAACKTKHGMFAKGMTHEKK